jgi:3-oxoacyl-(acyl-carrier-protein) synthase
MSATASGFIPGSGAGALVLESLDSAVNRGAKIYAEIKGGHLNAGGQVNGGSMTAPNDEGVIRCIQKAFQTTETEADQIDLINGHLTATMNDSREVKNWSLALNRKGVEFPIIQSTKSLIGHCLSAAGSIESVAAVLQLHKGFVHASANCEDLNPEIEELIDSDCIARYNPSQKVQCIAKSGFGFGDVNSVVIFARYE